jgi:imidazolonepropionase-like amidohydrolase
MLGIDDRVGSLSKGKDADVVVFDGDPFEYTSHVEQVLVDGATTYRRH